MIGASDLRRRPRCQASAHRYAPAGRSVIADAGDAARRADQPCAPEPAIAEAPPAAQNWAGTRGFGPGSVTYCEVRAGARLGADGVSPRRACGLGWPRAARLDLPLAAPADDPGSYSQADQRHSRSTIWRLGARFLPTSLVRRSAPAHAGHFDEERSPPAGPQAQAEP